MFLLISLIILNGRLLEKFSISIRRTGETRTCCTSKRQVSRFASVEYGDPWRCHTRSRSIEDSHRPIPSGGACFPLPKVSLFRAFRKTCTNGQGQWKLVTLASAVDIWVSIWLPPCKRRLSEGIYIHGWGPTHMQFQRFLDANSLISRNNRARSYRKAFSRTTFITSNVNYSCSFISLTVSALLVSRTPRKHHPQYDFTSLEKVEGCFG